MQGRLIRPASKIGRAYLARRRQHHLLKRDFGRITFGSLATDLALAVSLEAAKLTALIRDTAIRLLGARAVHDLRVVHVQVNNTLINVVNVHRDPAS